MAAQRAPLVDGEVIWQQPDGYYHHYPSMQRLRVWLAAAGFALQEEAEEPWHAEGYAYHHVLARLAALQAEDVRPLWHLDRPRSRCRERRGYRG